MSQTPILFLIFNRPDTTQQVFNVISRAKPKQLFVAADGPRVDREGEKETCKITRAIIDQVNWDCEVKTLFRDENLGCGKAVSSAITWFFSHVEQGIILEDDCLPHPDFFEYCTTLLDYYKDDKDVMFIGANNFQNGIKRGEASYYFSSINHIWGWATWRSTWEKYCFDMSLISAEVMKETILRLFENNAGCRRYWMHIFSRMQRKEVDTWDYQLTFSLWLNQGLSVVPNANLVSNIGFGQDATHTTVTNSAVANMQTFSILPIVHPKNKKIDKEADVYYIREYKIRMTFLRYYYKGAKRVVSDCIKKIFRNDQH